MNRFRDLMEKKLTPAEKKKREEIAKAMERDNPGMDMKKKMAIATWQAKKVAEDNLNEISKKKLGDYIKRASDDVVSKGVKIGATSATNPKFQSIVHKTAKRQMNIHKAIDKLTTEEGEPGHYMYKDGKKKLVHNKAEHDDAVIDGWKMKESVNEAADPQMDRVKQLVRLGLMDKKDLAKIVRALTLMKDGKVVPPRERAVLFDMLNELIGMITGDDAIFQRARKAVREAAEDDEPASPDEESMAMRQLDFIAYAAEEVMDHIEDGKEFPEWMQNKLTKVHTGMEGLHSSLGAHGDNDKEDNVKEAVELDEISKGLASRYLKKSASKAFYAGTKFGRAGEHLPHDKATADAQTDKSVRKFTNTLKGVERATNRLMKKEAVELDEISIELGKKVAAARHKQSRDWETKARIVRGKAGDHAKKMADDAWKKANKTDRAVYKKEYGKERKLSWEGVTREDVRTADRKPELYIAPDGRKRIRMIPVDKKVVSKDD